MKALRNAAPDLEIRDVPVDHLPADASAPHPRVAVPMTLSDHDTVTRAIGAELKRDPELRVTPKGTAICTFSLAVNRKFRDESGADREEVTYVDIEAWGKSGENISKYCTKGRPL